MKKLLSSLAIILAVLCSVAAGAQTRRSPSQQGGNNNSGNSNESSDSEKPAVIVKPSAWKMIEPLGLREESTIDTLFMNYSRRSVPNDVTDAWCTTGNLGTEGLNMIWMDREPTSTFFFRDALRAWLPSVKTMKFYNTARPMTLLSYNVSGGRETSQDRLQGIFSGNINKRAQVGALLDYIYSKGSYENQALKDLIWGFSGSYIGDRFEFQGFYNHWNSLNKENGGITDDLYITDPAKLQGGVSSINPKSIPTNLANATSRVVGGELLMNSRYKVGFWHEEQDPEVDSIIHRTYIPVTSFVWTLNYRQGRHVFRDDNLSETKKFFENAYLNPSTTYDKTTFMTLSNTFGVSLLEGFNKYAKFGLAAYVTHELRKFTQTPDTLDRTIEDLEITPFPEGFVVPSQKTTQNLAWVGAQLTKQKGSLLTFEATGQLGFLGPAAGDVNINGNIGTRFRLFGDSVSIRANVAFNNEHAPFLMNEYISNHFVWHNDFGKERTLRFGGVLDIPHTGSRLSVAVDNVQNHIYFNENCLPTQHSGSVQVFSARLDQHLGVGILNWDNRITYQTTGDDAIIPLPSLAVYSNLYLLFKIATLSVQLGIDCDYYTKYYSPLYQPATMSFANQRKTKVGNYPFMNAYANMRLGKVRFYVMMSHVNQGLTGRNYFSMPGYPMNPRRFQLGLSVDFAD